jgi:hypothetical protein
MAAQVSVVTYVSGPMPFGGSGVPVSSYHEQRPDSVVDEDGGCCDEHAEAHEAVELG